MTDSSKILRHISRLKHTGIWISPDADAEWRYQLKPFVSVNGELLRIGEWIVEVEQVHFSGSIPVHRIVVYTQALQQQQKTNVHTL